MNISSEFEGDKKLSFRMDVKVEKVLERMAPMTPS